jgi:hypothetical protein
MVIVGTGAFVVVDKFIAAGPIPNSIKQQLDFVVLYPPNSSDVHIDRSTVKYDPSNGVLSFVATTYGIKNTITEQATPDTFNDIPDYYSQFVAKMNDYQTLATYNGQADITRPSSLNGDQAAVMNAKGVLLFAHPIHDLSESQWLRFFNSLQVIR